MLSLGTYLLWSFGNLSHCLSTLGLGTYVPALRSHVTKEIKNQSLRRERDHRASQPKEFLPESRIRPNSGSIPACRLGAESLSQHSVGSQDFYRQ